MLVDELVATVVDRLVVLYYEGGDEIAASVGEGGVVLKYHVHYNIVVGMVEVVLVERPVRRFGVQLHIAGPKDVADAYLSVGDVWTGHCVGVSCLDYLDGFALRGVQSGWVKKPVLPYKCECLFVHGRAVSRPR